MDDINLIKSAAERLLEYGESDTGGKLSEEEILNLIEQTDNSIQEYDITGKVKTDINRLESINAGPKRKENENLPVPPLPERGGKRFSSTYQPEKNGRKKNVLKHLNDVYELSTHDVNGLIAQLLSLNVEELRAIISNPESTVIEIAYAAAIIRDIKKGKIETLETMLNRKIGRPDVKIRGMFGINRETEQAIKDLFDAEAENNSAAD